MRKRNLKNNKEIQILLAAHEGQRYIRPMVDSILEQDMGGWRLILSDDGEETAPILQKYAESWPDHILHYRSGRRFGSAQGHFMHLLRRFGGEADYTLLCDQDDVWHPDKLRRSLELMQRTETDPAQPVLLHTDLRVVDEQLRQLAPSFLRYAGLDGNRLALRQLLLQNVVTGCTVMLNRPLAELACRPGAEEGMRMHDWWLALLAASVGKCVFLDEATVDYRQHGDNVVGASGMGPGLLLRRMRRGGENRQRILAAMEQAGALARCYEDVLPPDALALLRDFAALPEQSRSHRLAFYRENDVWYQGPARRLGQWIWG